MLTERLPASPLAVEVIDGAALHISSGIINPMDHAQMHFEKCFALGRNMEQDKIAASLKDGVLTVLMPKFGLLESKEKDNSNFMVASSMMWENFMEMTSMMKASK